MKVQIIDKKDLKSLTSIQVVKRDGTVTSFYSYKINLILNALNARIDRLFGNRHSISFRDSLLHICLSLRYPLPPSLDLKQSSRKQSTQYLLFVFLFPFV